MKPVFVYMHHWYCGGTQTKPEQTHRRYLKLLIQQRAGIYDFTLSLLGNYHQRIGRTNLLSPSSGTQIVNNFVQNYDRFKKNLKQIFLGDIACWFLGQRLF